MFVGHYAASLALKRFEKRASLGVLFLAVQFVDIIFFPLVLLGIERLNIVENFTQSTHFELEHERTNAFDESGHSTLPRKHLLESTLGFANSRPSREGHRPLYPRNQPFA